MKQSLKRYWTSIKPWAKKVSFPGFFKVPIWDVISFSLKEFQRFDLMIRANAVSFSFFLALFPSLIALFTLTPFLKESILGFLPADYSFDAYLQEEIQKIMPGNAGDRLFNFIEDLGQSALGLPERAPCDLKCLASFNVTYNRPLTFFDRSKEF